MEHLLQGKLSSSLEINSQIRSLDCLRFDFQPQLRAVSLRDTINEYISRAIPSQISAILRCARQFDGGSVSPPGRF
jgi:hypothetical protein